MRAHDMHFTCIPTTKTEECCPTFSAPAFYSPHYPEKGDTKLASHSSPSSSSPRCKTEKSAFLARFICFNFCAPGPPQIFTRFFKHPYCFKWFFWGFPASFPSKSLPKNCCEGTDGMLLEFQILIHLMHNWRLSHLGEARGRYVLQQGGVFLQDFLHNGMGNHCKYL